MMLSFFAGMALGVAAGVLFMLACFWLAIHYREHPEDFDDEVIDIDID